MRATESAKKIVQQGDKYGMDINFGNRPGIERVRALQYSISLWRASDKTPLFDGTLYDPLSDLTLECAKSHLEAQKALCALVSPGEASFERYQDMGSSFGISRGKDLKSTIALRDNARGKTPFAHFAQETARSNNQALPKASVYFEDRLASSEAEPALDMLVPLGGIVNGIKQYMRKKGLVDREGKPAPAKLKSFINSPEFSTATSKERVSFNIPGNHTSAIPLNFRDALKNLQGSSIAIEIMGEEFHKAFCEEYAKKAMSGASR